MTNDDGSDYLMPEQAVLGAAMLGEDGRNALMALQPEDFLDRKHRIIAAAARTMILRGEKPDQITLCAELEARGQLDGPRNAGGYSYVLNLETVVAIASNGWHYAEIVRNATRVRASKRAASLLNDATAKRDAAGSLDELLAIHAAAIAEIPEPLNADQATIPTIADLFEKRFEHRWLVPGLLARR